MNLGQNPNKKLFPFFSDKLDISVSPTSIERAHRLGKYQVESTRPLIVKFLSFKDKQRALAAASKLRETNSSISQDYSKNVRIARKKLAQFTVTAVVLLNCISIS